MDSLKFILKEEILRALVLSQSIEPLANKPGCTTREVDSTPGTRLEYFTISAVNSVWPFMELVDRITATGLQPKHIFDVAYEAQRRSPRNRNGGKVNYASILMLLPLVTGQCLLEVEGANPYDARLIIQRADMVVRATGPEDVKYLQMFVDHSRLLSEQHHRRLGTTRAQLYPTFTGKYDNVMDAMSADQFSHMIMATEIQNQYPYSQRVLKFFEANEKKGLITASELIYPALRMELGRHDISADCIVTAFYLAVATRQSAVLFP